MAAEPVDLIESSRAKSGSLCFSFGRQAAAEQYLERLKEISIPAEAVTVIEVSVREPGARVIVEEERKTPWYGAYTVAGASIGCALAIGIGLVLNRSNFLSLTFLETILVYFCALSLLGTVLGGAMGAIIASYRYAAQPRIVTRLTADAILVVVKAPSEEIRQCEFLARNMGARKIEL